MPTTNSMSLDEIIRDAVAPVLERASAAIARAIAEATALGVSQGRARSSSKGAATPRRPRAAAPRARRNVELKEWAADRRARRVPTFVIEATGLDTKKKIVAKFGEGATFKKGKPLPAPQHEPSGRSGAAPDAASAARQVVAKPPRVRKAVAG